MSGVCAFARLRVCVGAGVSPLKTAEMSEDRGPYANVQTLHILYIKSLGFSRVWGVCAALANAGNRLR